jgi:hypothetical protein
VSRPCRDRGSTGVARWDVSFSVAAPARRSGGDGGGGAVVAVDVFLLDVSRNGGGEDGGGDVGAPCLSLRTAGFIGAGIGWAWLRVAGRESGRGLRIGCKVVEGLDVLVGLCFDDRIWSCASGRSVWLVRILYIATRRRRRRVLAFYRVVSFIY